MVSGRLARPRKSDAGGPEVVNERFDKELHIENWVVSSRLARPRKSAPGVQM